MRIILIDDEANFGWYEVVSKALFANEEIECAIDILSATEKLSTEEYDLILLDLRFGESDHDNSEIENFGGYTILRNFIRNSFFSLNFPTPVILFTASNKAWHIFDMIDSGVDDFYVKEHPDLTDLEFSRKNYLRLLSSIISLKALGNKRREIWKSILDISVVCEVAIANNNIRNRIIEKLKIGYGLLFRKTTSLENKELLFNNEIIAFIVFWSILEEISHDFFSRREETDIEWILRKNGKQLQWRYNDNTIKTLFSTIKDEVNTESVSSISVQSHHISLSSQIAAILRYQKNWNHHKIHLSFLSKLNKFRNDIDFIHSDTQSILNNSLSKHYDSLVGYEKCTQILTFINEILLS